MKYKNIAIISDKTEKAQNIYNELIKKCDFKDINSTDLDVIVVLGGDGFMLHSLHQFMDLNIPLYGINCGSVGFLLNNLSKDEHLFDVINKSIMTNLPPLKMKVIDADNRSYFALAINEVSLLRESQQTAKIRIIIDGLTRIEELCCDGMVVSTAAGSTAYNFSVGGAIIPIGTPVIAVTPISPFRPRNWRGAILSNKSKVRFEIINHQKRPVSAVADFHEVRNIVSVEIEEDRNQEIKLLFDPNHSLEERIIREQFVN